MHLNRPLKFDILMIDKFLSGSWECFGCLQQPWRIHTWAHVRHVAAECCRSIMPPQNGRPTAVGYVTFTFWTIAYSTQISPIQLVWEHMKVKKQYTSSLNFSCIFMLPLGISPREYRQNVRKQNPLHVAVHLLSISTNPLFKMNLYVNA